VPGERPQDQVCGPGGSRHWHVTVGSDGGCASGLPIRYRGHLEAHTSAVPCPVQPNRFEATVTPEVALDPSGLRRYRYTVASAPSSEQAIASFQIRFGGGVQDIESPPGWSAVLGPRVVHWYASTPDPAWPDDGYRVPPGLDQIKPGRSLSGFAFKSQEKEGVVAYAARGFVPLPASVPELAAEETLDECPDSFKPVVGSTMGPSPALRFHTVAPCRILDTRDRESLLASHVSSISVVEGAMYRLRQGPFR
jgi:hypothetical protein